MGTLCLQGLRNTVDVKVRVVVRTYIRGGTCLVRPASNFGAFGGCFGRFYWEIDAFLAQNPIKLWFFIIFIIKSSFLHLKIKIWMNFVLPMAGQIEAPDLVTGPARGDSDAKLRPSHCVKFCLVAWMRTPIGLVAWFCFSCLPRRIRRCWMLPFACMPWHCGVWYVLWC